MADVVVLNEVIHGFPSRNCASALRGRIGDREVGVAASNAEEASLIRDAEVAVGLDVREEVLAQADNLRLFACASAGFDYLDLEAFRERDITVTNAAGVHGSCIAEHVLGWMFFITRRFDEAVARQQRTEWRKFQARGVVNGSRVCIVGMGALGKTLTERLSGFDVETVGVRYTPEKGGPTDHVYGFDEIEQAVTGADYLVVTPRLTEATTQLISTDELEALPPDAVVINVARGPIVDTEALTEALRGNRLAAAALDVTDPEPLPPEHPLWNFGNVFITPHTAGHTPGYWERVADILVENLQHIDEQDTYEGLKNQVT